VLFAGDFFIDTGLGPVLGVLMPVLVLLVLVRNVIVRSRDRKRDRHGQRGGRPDNEAGSAEPWGEAAGAVPARG
jgi:hypothetical protein